MELSAAGLRVDPGAALSKKKGQIMWGFLLSMLFRRQFWYLFVASFTMVVMLAWRQQLRDEIFHLGEYYSRGRRL
jgi:TctA family transporter